jgi:biotin carboxylase
MEEKSKSLWIIKPVANACGRGIRLINSKKKFKLQNKKNFLASEYIKKPHLINGNIIQKIYS